MEEDPAFVWQRQERRARPVDPLRERPTPAQGPPGARWVTLHEAEELTGVPASTVRNWARKEKVPTRFELATDGQVRMVALDEVVARARHLGRLRPKPAASAGPAPPRPEAPAGPPPFEAPEGAVLIPVDAWNRMVTQLGNLHEAGQQLAEARERAARAETEATFLRERLGELRRELEHRREEPEAEPEATPAPAVETREPPVDEQLDPAWLYLYRRWATRGRRRR